MGWRWRWMMVVTWRYSSVTSGAKPFLDLVPGGWMESCDQLCFCISQAERARQTASQPPCPESHRSWRWTEYSESLVWLLSLKLKPACKWCAFLRSRAWTASDQRSHCCGRRRWCWLDGWAKLAGGGGARQQEGLLAAAAKLASMSVLVPQQLSTATLRVLVDAKMNRQNNSTVNLFTTHR
jgi:hypothetical protein